MNTDDKHIENLVSGYIDPYGSFLSEDNAHDLITDLKALFAKQKENQTDAKPEKPKGSWVRLAIGDGKIVAVDADESVVSGPDSTTWHTEEPDAEPEKGPWWPRVTFHRGVYTHIDPNGTMWSSADGSVWTEVHPEVTPICVT